MRSVYTAHDVENEVQRMCDLSSVIENKAREEGIEFGELKTTVKYYRKGKLTIEKAAEDLNITVEEFTEKVNQFPSEVEDWTNEEYSCMAAMTAAMRSTPFPATSRSPIRRP